MPIMNQLPIRLVITDKPYLDESFVGYLTRLTDINAYETYWWVYKLSEIESFRSTSSSFDHNLNLLPLSLLTGVESHKLKKLQYLPASPTSSALGDHYVFNSTLPKYVIRPFDTKVCPSCLKENPYVRKQWEIKFITTCLEHKSLLIDKCPECKKKIKWNRSQINICDCKLDWTNIEQRNLEADELEVTKYLYNSLGLPVSSLKVPNENPLYDLSAKGVALCLIFIASQYAGKIDTLGKHLMPKRENETLHELFVRAFNVYKNWPHNFYAFLDWRRENQNNSKHGWGLLKEFREYKSALYRQMASKELDFLREAFDSYLLTHWNGGHISALKRFNQAGNEAKTFVSRTEAHEILRTSVESVDSFIERGLLKAIVKKQGNIKKYFIEKQSVYALKEKLERTINLAETEQILGLHKKRITQLVECGVIIPLRGPSVDNYGGWKFIKSDILGLLDRFNAKQMNGKKNRKDLIGFYDALEKYTRIGKNIGNFVNAVLTDKLMPVDKTCGYGLQGYLFSNIDLTKLILIDLGFNDENYISIEDAAKELSVSDETILCFIRDSFITSELIKTVTPNIQLIKKTIWRNFLEEYFLLTVRTAREFGVFLVDLMKNLSSKGIKPLFHGLAGRGHMYLYRKEDLLKVNFNILRKKARERRVKKINPNFVTKQRACEILQITEEEFQDYVERRIVRLYTRTTDIELYSLSIINKCKELGINVQYIISLSHAAKIAEMSCSYLWQKFSDSNQQAQLLINADGTRIRFILKKDFEEFLNRRKELFLSTRETAKLLNLTQAYITQLVYYGRLKPITGPTVDGSTRFYFTKEEINRFCQFKKREKDSLGIQN